MINRQRFLRSSAALAGAPLLGACSANTGVDGYEAAVRSTWRAGPAAIPPGEVGLLQRELVRCATLAPSSHNTQCWRFRLSAQAIEVQADLSRRCPVVDPDDHHLHVSLGCATENLLQAARAHGLRGFARYTPGGGGGGVVTIALEPGAVAVSPLFLAIPERQCSRSVYDGRALSNDELRLLERAGTGDGVSLRLLTERPAVEQVLEYVVAGNTAQVNDRAFVDELKAWIRFSRDEAVRTGDGLYSGASGNPLVPRWLGRRLFGAFFTVGSENDKYAAQVRSSAGLAVFVSEVDDPAHWVEAGRCYQRFALQATALGIRNAMLNPPVEVATLRPQFAGYLGIGARRPDLLVRFGRGPMMPRSLRRPLDTMLT
ncbi:MAG: Tat pathway signal protein [Pseudomonadota bacterium]|nr:Tat pathway signal protein [Pseudomonadota bacterium]